MKRAKLNDIIKMKETDGVYAYKNSVWEIIYEFTSKETIGIRCLYNPLILMTIPRRKCKIIGKMVGNRIIFIDKELIWQEKHK